MKQLKLLLLSILFSTSSLFAQTQISIGTPTATEVFYDTKYDPVDGGTINVGYIGTSGIGNGTECYITKLDASKNIVWQKTIANPGDDYFSRVVKCANGDYVVVGSYTISGKRRGLVCRITNAGVLLWSTTSQNTASPNGDIFYDVIETAAGNIAIAGVTNFIPSSTNGIVILLNSAGTQTWGKMFTWNSSDEFRCINQLPAGNLIVGGTYYTGSGYYRALVVEIGESLGTVINQTDYTFTGASPGNPNLNSRWPIRCYINSGAVVFDMIAFTGSTSTATAYGVYTYNLFSRALTGNIFYHTGFTTAGASTTCPVGADDYIITQSLSSTQSFVSRVTSGVSIFDRQVNSTVNSIYSSFANGSSLYLGGFTQGNDAYVMYHTTSFPTSSAPCNITNSNTLQVVPNTPTSLTNTTAFNTINAMLSISLNLVNTSGVVADICGAQTCPADTTINVSKCSNQGIVLNARAGDTYSWSPATGLSSTTVQSPVCTATSNITYTVTITNNTTNCTYHDVFNVNVNPAPSGYYSDTSLCLGDTLQLSVTGGGTYSWSPNYNINNTTISNPLVWPAVTTTYIATITNENGCSSNDTIKVIVNNCHCEDSCNWSLTGNTNVKARNFIGSINAADFKVRTNNIQRMVVNANGNVGIGTASASKLLDVNGEARIGVLPATVPNQNIVFADGSGNLQSLAASGNTSDYLSGNGTWQPLTGGGGTINADQGCTLQAGNTVVLGDDCGAGGGAFRSNREVNMNNLNLYFNSNNSGKVRIGPGNSIERFCPTLYSRLELDATGLRTVNGYASPTPSPSGLRFNQLTALTPTISNKYNGVLSLDEDGDVIWVQACCDKIGTTDKQMENILERLTKLEAELAATKAQVAQLDVVLEKNNIIILGQNTPNPFSETTIINYSIPKVFASAQLVFTTTTGEIIKTTQIKTSGKGTINVYGSGISSGLYTYTLIIDGKVIESKKMVKL